ncbi:MAG TPA: phenylacetate--CoA ligase [Armatimonadota bacterium]|jgi:phenylacetate-CoA ligase
MYEFALADQLSRSEIEALQLVRLREAVARAARAPHYQRVLGAAGLSAESIQSLDDLRRLPLTTKDDLRAGMPWEFLAVPRREVVRMHYSSGTTGIATAVYHTRGDLSRWAECVARGLLAVGVTDEDVFQNMMGYGLFTGGLGLHYGGELVGCMTIPASAGNTARQVQMMRLFETTLLHILPSYALHVAHYCEQEGLRMGEDIKVRYGFLGGEPHTEDFRQRIQEAWGAKFYNCYGLSELAGPGVAMECRDQGGFHLREDHYLAEILDPQTQEPVAEGEEGELVLTALTREAMPLLRYRTRDVTQFVAEPCPCGNQHRRLARMRGRSDDMLILRGVNFYPMQVERVLMAVPEVGHNYCLVLTREGDLDRLTVQVELNPDYSFDDVRSLEGIRTTLAEGLHRELLSKVNVELLEPHRLPVTEGKAVRVVDKRGD